MKIKFIPQHDQMDCGPAALAMIAGYYGKKYSLQYLRDLSYITKEGVSIGGISHAAKHIGLDPHVIQLSLDELRSLIKKAPCILHWNQNHFVVLYGSSRSLINGRYRYKIADSGYGMITVDEPALVKSWISNKENGIAVFFTPTERFPVGEEVEHKNYNFYYLRLKLKPFKWKLLQIFLAILFTSCCTLIFPFITQAVVDKGIALKNINIVLVLLSAQVFLYIGSTTIDIIRNWITLHLGTKLNIQIVSDFLKKILKLPISFFDIKQKGDFNQRIQDQSRIDSFLTSQGLITLFSLLNLFVFFAVLLYYDIKIVLAYISLTAIAVVWSLFFLNKLKILDYYRFQIRSENQETIYELINGIEEIKLNNLEEYKEDNWNKIQIRLFNINIRSLKTTQFQVIGFEFINQLKNILVTFITAYGVINNHITIGMMLSIAYIVGLMNVPINQLTNFLRSFQDAKLSLDRLNEIQKLDGEDKMISNPDYSLPVSGADIKISNLHFQYGNPNSPIVLNNISITIPEGKTTAIVGSSGSGKTTFMKLLLKFYKPTHGHITIGGHPLENIPSKGWRNHCGVVMQNGYIFADTVEQNIICGDTDPDKNRLSEAINIANISEFIDSLPLGLNTKIGAAGNGISGGQRQRILIARAVYKNPHYLFLDEATSALDTENEKIIHDNLQTFFKGKTVVVIAHRLSTVKNADQIIMLKNGSIIEKGNHSELVIKKNHYYNLVKNQLDLSN